MAERILHVGIVRMTDGGGIETSYHVTATKSRVTVYATQGAQPVGKRWNSQTFSDPEKTVRLFYALTSGMDRQERCQILTHTF